MAEQTYIKVLLAPAWEHNYPDGPSEWLDNVQTGSAPFSATSAPHFHTKTGRKAQTGDKYYRTPNGGQSSDDMKYVDKWWPKRYEDALSSAVYVFDADPRVFNASGNIQAPTTSTGSGGFGSTSNEERYTKNRVRFTGEPMSAFNNSDPTTIDIQLQALGSSGTVRDGFKPYPNHFQDTVHDAIIQGSFDTGDTPVTPANELMYPNKPNTPTAASSAGNAGSLTYGAVQTPSRGHQAGNVWAANGASTAKHTYGYEFTLNVNSLTHSWDTITSIVPLPHDANTIVGGMQDATQISGLSIDLGSMRETIQVQGILDDSAFYTGQMPSTERWVRRQELMDIVRAQWGATLAMGEADSIVGNPNRYVALTIGPMYTDNPYGDRGKTIGVQPHPGTTTPLGGLITNDGTDATDPHNRHVVKLKALDMWRFGDEPHDDMRGTEIIVQDSDSPMVFAAFDYKPNYQGRRRYRGLIKNLELTLQGGSPDIWEYSFEFQVYKNETSYRRTSDVEEPDVIKPDEGS